MKKISLAFALAISMFALASCGSDTPEYVTPPVSSALPSMPDVAPLDTGEVTDPIDSTTQPEDSPTPSGNAVTGGNLQGKLTDQQVEEIMAGSSEIEVGDTERENLSKMTDDMQPVLTAFSELSSLLAESDLENSDWVSQITEYSETLETACDTAMSKDYGESLAELKSLLDAGYDACKSGITNLKEAVNEQDVDKMNAATTWLMLGIDYLTQASSYHSELSNAE